MRGPRPSFTRLSTTTSALAGVADAAQFPVFSFIELRLYLSTRSAVADGGNTAAPCAITSATTNGEHMKGFIDNIESLTEENRDFRRVLYTAKQMQLVLMALQPGEEIGEETHDDRDQFFRVEAGSGEIFIDGVWTKVHADMAMIVPAGARHNVKNTGKDTLKLYTIYAPPEHVEGTVHKTKVQADAADEHFDGRTTE